MSAIAVKAKASSPRRPLTSDIDERRRAVARLVITAKRSAAEVSRELGVSVKTIYADLAVIRREMADATKSNESGVQAHQFLMDSLNSSNVRAQMLWQQVEESRQERARLILALENPVDEEDNTPALMTPRAEAIERWDKLARNNMRDIRKEEEHQSKMLQRFNVLRSEATINQNVSVRDETPMVKVIADFINQEIRDPQHKRRLVNVLDQKLRAAAVLTGS